MGSASHRLMHLVRRPWVPAAFFAVLCTVYFSGFIFTDDVIRGLDTGTEYHSGREPFLEKVRELQPENWSRYLGGTPRSGYRQPKYFPLHVIYLFTSRHRYLGWRYVFAVFAAGCFSYLFFRALGFKRLTCILAGSAYACAPTLMTFIYPGQEAKMLVIGLFPLMAWGIYRIIDTGRWAYTLPVAAAVGAGIYTPHLQMLYYALIGVALLGLVKLLVDALRHRLWRQSARRLGLCAAAAVIGLSVGSVGFVPQYWYTRTESRRAGPSGEGVGIEYAQSWALHPEEIASLLLPEFVHFDTAKQRSYWGRNPFKINAEYFGLVPLLFAALSLRHIGRDRRLIPLLSLFVFGLAFSLGPHTPVHGFFYHYVPGMKLLRVPGMIAFLVAFSACAMGALELDRLLGPRGGQPSHTRVTAVVAAAASVPLLFLALAPEAAYGIWTRLFWPDIPAENFQIATANHPPAARAAAVSLLLLWSTVLVIWRRTTGRLSELALFGAVLAIILIDTWRIDKQFLVYVDPDHHAAPEQVYPDIIRFFEKDAEMYRVFVAARLQPSIPDIDLVTVPYHEPFTIRRYDTITQQENLNLATLSLLNTRYIVSKKPIGLPSLKHAASANGLQVYRNPAALPWFYTASRVEIEPDEDRLLDKLRNGRHNPMETVIIERPLQEPDSLDGGDTSLDRIRTVSYDPYVGRIELEVETQGARVLVISENYHPFWSAFVDGEETPVFRANYVWKGLQIPSGSHRVEFVYRDPIASVCRWLSLLSACAVFLAGAWVIRRQWGSAVGSPEAGGTRV